MDTRRSKTSIEISNTEEDQSKKRRATLRAEESSCATEGVKRRKTEGTTHHYHHPQKKKASEMKYFVGAHVSIAGGFGNAVKRAHRIGGNAFALFTNSQRQWNAADKPITQSEFDDMQTHLKECGIEPGMVLPHGSYLINLGSPEDDKLQKSRNFFLKEVSRVRGLGLQLYNFHPGSTLGKITEEECCDRVADSVNWLHKQEDSGDVVILLENTAGQGNNIGYKFEHLRHIIDRIEDKSRIGVCIDTCHAFAAGYDLRTKEAFDETWSAFERIIGFNYLRAMHINDSKGDLGCRKDRHESLGKGRIGWDCFKFLMQDPRFRSIPLILETPSAELYPAEIATLFKFAEQGDAMKTEVDSNSDEKTE